MHIDFLHMGPWGRQPHPNHLAGAIGMVRQRIRRKSERPGKRTPAVERLEPRMLLADDPAIGINLDPIVDFGTAWVFTDVFKTSRPWISHAYNADTGQEAFGAGGPVQVNDNGWPLRLSETINSEGQLIQQRLSTLMFRDIGDKYPAGIYRAEWKGSGDVRWEFAATVVEQGVQPDGTHYALLNVTPSDAGISFRINSMDPSNPIRDVRLWMPEFEDQVFDGQAWTPGDAYSPFHPAFVDSLEPFSTLRFMDWTDTNRSSLVEWDHRRSVSHARQRGEDRGIAYEYLIELANSTGKNVWLNMPHQASDDFITQYATLIRDSLDPELKIYIEYSNEVWNGQFDAFQWITEQLPDGDNARRWEVTAQEMKRDFEIWSSVFAGQEERISRVASGFTEVPQVTEEILGHLDGAFDAIAIGSYVFLTDEQRSAFDASTTADEILDAAMNNLSTNTLERVEDHVALAQQHSQQLGREIDVVIYEGGQLLVPGPTNPPYAQAMFDAQRSPRMYELYEQLLKGLDQHGVDLFNHFSHVNKFTNNSTTAALEYQLQSVESAPKYQALRDAATGELFAPEFTLAESTFSEGKDAFAILPIELSEPLLDLLTFELTATDGTATGMGVDYGFDSAPPFEYSIDDGQTWARVAQVTLPAGQQRFLARLPIVDDAVVEPTESFEVRVNSQSGYSSVAKVNISSDDGEVDLDGELVSHWTFMTPANPVLDSAPAGTVQDEGTLVGNAHVEVSPGSPGALHLDGAGDWMRVGASTDINNRLVEQRSIALSFRADDVQRRQVLFEEGGSTRGLHIYIEDEQLFVGGWNNPAWESSWQGTWLTAPIEKGEWNHATLVLDGTAERRPDSLVAYLNGVRVWAW